MRKWHFFCILDCGYPPFMGRYMVSWIYWPFTTLLSLVFPAGEAVAQAPAAQKVIFVNLDVSNPADAGKCYSTAYDKGKVEIPLGEDDPLAVITDYSLEEDELEGPNCFMPEIKLIYERYTYIVSLYCTSVKKYKNSAPYVPSSTPATNDLQMTETVLSVLENLRKKYFGVTTNSKYANAFVKKEPFSPLDTKVDDVIVPDDKDDDTDIQNDAIDKEGWFEEESPDAVRTKINGDFKTGDDDE